MEDRRKRPSAVMRKQAGYVFKQQIARLPGFSQAGKFKEEGATGVSESLAASSKAESLAGKSAAEQVEVGHGCGVGVSGIFDVPLSFAIEQRTVTALGVFVALAVSHAGETAGTGQPLAEAADAGKHVNKTNGLSASLPNKKRPHRLPSMWQALQASKLMVRSCYRASSRKRVPAGTGRCRASCSTQCASSGVS